MNRIFSIFLAIGKSTGNWHEIAIFSAESTFISTKKRLTLEIS